VLPHQAACFELDLLRELGGHDTEFGLAADQLFMLRAALLTPPATIPEFLCDFDRGGAGSQRTPFRHYFDAIRARRRTGMGSGARGALDAVISMGLASGESMRRLVAARWT
jgi:hypothetical protein